MVIASRARAAITGKLSAPSPQPANRARTADVGTILSAADKVDRSTVELVAVSVGNAYGTSCRTQLGTNDAKFAREAVSLVDRVIRVFEDHAALAFEVRADDEIKIEVWHWSSLPVPAVRNLTRVWLVPPLQLYFRRLIAVACCVSVPRPHHRVHIDEAPAHRSLRG